jgi:adenosylcobinamide-GDP ribazoletransferase
MIPKRHVAELGLAITFLTRVPVGRLPDPLPSLAEASWAFPLVGAALGAIAWLSFVAGSALGFSTAICAVLAVILIVLLTGALHEDGLADFVDGVGGGRTRSRRLEIMRDSRIGSYGVIALIACLVLRALGIAEVGQIGNLLACFVAVAAASRFCMVAALVLLPAARPDGLGSATSGVTRTSLIAGLVVTCVCLAALGSAAVVVALVMAFAAAIVGVAAKRYVGGQTGDVLGATQCVSDAAGWVTLAATAV